MCDISGCKNEAVAFVDVDFPSDATYDPSTEDDDRSQPVPPQRVGYCVLHAAELGLTSPISTAHAVAGLQGTGRFPSDHILANSYSWTVG